MPNTEMGILLFVVEMTEALAWPVAIIIILVLFRQALPSLIERIRSLKYGSFEAAFDEQRVQVAESISEAPRPAAIPDVNDELLKLAQKSPRGAIIEAWIRIEKRLHELADEAKIDKVTRFNMRKLLGALRSEHVLAPEVESALLGLMHLRSLAVHASGEDLTIQKAIDFVTLAATLLWLLQKRGQ